MNASEAQQEIKSWLNHAPHDHNPSEGEKGVLLGVINSSLKINGSYKDTNFRRHQVLAWLFREVLDKSGASGISSKELTNEMWWALYQLIEPRKDQDSGMWVGRDGVSSTLFACWQAMERWQQEMDNQLAFLDELK